MCTDGHPQPLELPPMASVAEEMAPDSHHLSCSGSTQGEGHPCDLCTHWKACLALSTWDPHVPASLVSSSSSPRRSIVCRTADLSGTLAHVPALCLHPLLLSLVQGPGPAPRGKGDLTVLRGQDVTQTHTFTYTEAHKETNPHTDSTHTHSLVPEEPSQHNGGSHSGGL